MKVKPECSSNLSSLQNRSTSQSVTEEKPGRTSQKIVQIGFNHKTNQGSYQVGATSAGFSSTARDKSSNEGERSESRVTKFRNAQNIESK